LFDSDGLAGEDLAEIDFLPIEADAATGCDGGSPVMEWVIDVRKAPIGSWRRPVSLRGILHVECLMRPLIVVAIDEIIELGLLLQEVAGSRLGGLQLERQVHALVAAVLLRVAGFDAFDRNAEPEPSDREFGQVEERIGACEGDAVVGADGVWQTELLEDISKTVKA
jgi:hypothetical protein